jgi:uncharacterized protein YbcC (UPF0753/DUF2309 family)
MNLDLEAKNFSADQIIRPLRPLLPFQNPLHTFVHINALQGFEHLKFPEAVLRAGRLYGASPWKAAHPNVPVSLLAQAAHDVRSGQRRWLGSSVDESDLNIARELQSHPFVENIAERIPSSQENPLRPAYQWNVAGVPFDRILHEAFVPLVSSYLDQGVSLWTPPLKGLSFRSFVETYLKSSLVEPEDWISRWEKSLLALPKNPEQAFKVCLQAAPIKETDWSDYCLEVLFDLRGWSGLVNKLETEPESAPIQAPPVTLLDYLIAKISAETALQESLVASKRAYPNPVRSQASHSEKTTHSPWNRARIWHEAIENTFYQTFLKSFHQSVPQSEPMSPAADILFCIDDREEALRRNVEFHQPHLRTWGVPGFFSLDMMFHPAEGSRGRAQCPPVIQPSVHFHAEDSGNPRRRQIRNFLARAFLWEHAHGRSLWGGMLASLLGGPVAALALILETASPSLWSKALTRLRETLQASSRLAWRQSFTNEKAAHAVRDTLVGAGLIRSMAPLVVVLGHEASSRNNPFRQAYGCGACGGHSGAPNARIFAKMANDPKVREILKSQGVEIPDSTFFVAACHDTTIDQVAFFPGEKKLPENLEPALKAVRETFAKACVGSATERFQFLNKHSNEHVLDQALKRSQDMAETRPEYGHSRVAAAVFGRRTLTRGMDLGRRSFLISYNPDFDTDGTILRDVLIAALPVCANIGLDYYFSAVDSEGFGAGSKLPLNVISLLGLVSGAGGDVRMGLARQMTDIHEPMRMLVLVEARKDFLEKAILGHPRLRNLVENDWVRLVRVDPENSKNLELRAEGQWIRWEDRHVSA